MICLKVGSDDCFLTVSLKLVLYINKSFLTLEKKFLYHGVSMSVHKFNLFTVLFLHFPVILNSYQWLICWLLQETHRRLCISQERGEDKFTARNNAQVFRARTLSLAYAEVRNYDLYFYDSLT
jgi:hypothetical protein